MAYTNADDTISLQSLVGPMMLDVPYPIAQQGILWSAIEFCERTRCYANKQTNVIQIGQTGASLTPSDDALISDIEEVRWDGYLIGPMARSDADDELRKNPTGKPLGYYRKDPESITLIPVPDSSNTLDVILILTPTRTATSIPRFLYDYHWDAIEHGARYRLMGMTNRPWADPNMAAYHRQQFEFLIGAYSIRADKDGTKRPMRSKLNF